MVGAVKAIAARGVLDIAKRAHQTMGQVFRYAIAHSKESKATRNPATDIKPSDII
jgi:Fe-S cluster assembly scaffold protein SufB